MLLLEQLALRGNPSDLLWASTRIPASVESLQEWLWHRGLEICDMHRRDHWWLQHHGDDLLRRASLEEEMSPRKVLQKYLQPKVGKQSRHHLGFAPLSQLPREAARKKHSEQGSLDFPPCKCLTSNHTRQGATSSLESRIGSPDSGAGGFPHLGGHALDSVMIYLHLVTCGHMNAKIYKEKIFSNVFPKLMYRLCYVFVSPCISAHR